MNYNEIIQETKAKSYYPIYFLYGDEPFYVDKIVSLMENCVMTEEEKDFNFTNLYGNETNMGEVIDNARQYPMMAEKRLVIVKEAQHLKDIAKLQEYIDNVVNTTILVIAYKTAKLDKRKSVFKNLSKSKNCVLFESKKLYDNEVPNWITAYCKSKNISINPKSALILAENLGNDLSKIENEINKLRTAIPTLKNIDEKIIEEYIGISKEYNVFELVDAINNKDMLKANRIINYLSSNKKSTPTTVAISNIYRHFNRVLTYHYHKSMGKSEMAKALGINPYFLKDYEKGASNYSAIKCTQIISLAREYDLMTKGGGEGYVDQFELLKEFVFRITH